MTTNEYKTIGTEYAIDALKINDEYLSPDIDIYLVNALDVDIEYNGYVIESAINKYNLDRPKIIYKNLDCTNKKFNLVVPSLTVIPSLVDDYNEWAQQNNTEVFLVTSMKVVSTFSSDCAGLMFGFDEAAYHNTVLVGLDKYSSVKHGNYIEVGKLNIL